jgi:hypothetical protein
MGIVDHLDETTTHEDLMARPEVLGTVQTPCHDLVVTGPEGRLCVT